MVSFVILSIPVSEEKALFDLANQLAKPYTTQLFIKVKSSFKENISQTKEIPNMLFNNTSEVVKKGTDKVVQKKSAVKKNEILNGPHEDYTREEREAILSILKNAN